MVVVADVTYPEGETYSGSAVSETSYFEFLKTYSMSEATTNIITSIEQAARSEGRTLLSIYIDYTSGYLYHEFNVTYKYYMPGQVMSSVGWSMGENGQVVKLAIQIIPLLTIIIPFLTAIVYYFLVTSSLKEVKEIIYGPPGKEGAGGITGTLLLAVALFGGAYLLTALVPAIRAIRGPGKETVAT